MVLDVLSKVFNNNDPNDQLQKPAYIKEERDCPKYVLDEAHEWHLSYYCALSDTDLFVVRESVYILIELK